MPLGEPFQPTEPEWLILAQAGIKTTSEIPRIIPPLPEGDTKDLKVWREYWKQHDAAIRDQVVKEFLDCAFLPGIVHPDSEEGKFLKIIAKKLRTTEAAQK